MSYLIWQGPSAFDGQPIRLLASDNSKNLKTGNLVQTYILHAEVSPWEAWKTGQDKAICGACPLKGSACYVSLFRGVTAVSRNPKSPPKRFFKNRGVRLGTYGDPAMVPYEVWESILAQADFHTGYTHQWRWCDPRFREILMASVDSPQDRRLAKSQGWRTFRTLLPGEDREGHERPCPANTAANLTCAICKGCDGNYSERKMDFAIEVHGTTANVKRYKQFRASLSS